MIDNRIPSAEFNGRTIAVGDEIRDGRRTRRVVSILSAVRDGRGREFHWVTLAGRGASPMFTGR